MSTILSLIVLSSKSWDIEHYAEIKNVIEHIDISKFILDVMLGFLLFAGSLHTNWADIKSQLKPITLFAVGGVLLSTIIIAGLLFFICNLFHFPIGFKLRLRNSTFYYVLFIFVSGVLPLFRLLTPGLKC